MKSSVLALAVFLASQSALASSAQPATSPKGTQTTVPAPEIDQPSQQANTEDLLRDVLKLLSKTYNDRAELQRQADKLARGYAPILKKIKTEVVALVEAQMDRLGLQQKLNLAVELWRVRASVDLLRLVDANTLKELTGLTLPDLNQLQKRLRSVKVW